MLAGAWVCLFAPLAGAIAITLAGNRLSRTGAGIVATGSVVVAFAGALVSFFAMLGKDGDQRSELSTAWTWVGAGDFHAGLSVLVDPLSVFMMLVVSGVGALIVAAALFGIGALGVMLRRSPLIVLLSLEIMLNAGNLTLIAFARQLGNLDGQIFALAVMAVAAAEVAIGLGLIVAMARRGLALDVDQARVLRG